MTVKHSLFGFANWVLGPTPLTLEVSDRLAALRAEEARLAWRAEMAARLLAHAPDIETVPRAQLGQDLFALWATSFAHNRYFVEFGAADGVNLSNTFLLERSFSWNGIAAEPARPWHEALARNRRCIVDKRCVWTVSGQHVTFVEPRDALLSTMGDYADRDQHREARRNAVTYEVETVSLNDLLAQHSAPNRIDYLSIDTEGTEFEVLNTFDFERYDVQAITVEHNYDAARRDALYGLLQLNGFARVLTEISAFDDWYVKTRALVSTLA